MAKKSRKDWTPNTPAAELINYWVDTWARESGIKATREPTARRNYLYRQPQRTAAEMLFRRKERMPCYVVRVADDRAGRAIARTERYDPERGSGNPIRVDIPRLPGAIAVPMVVFAIAVCVILFVALPFPLSTIAMLYWSFSLFWRMAYAVERKRFAEHLRTRVEPPPLLSDAELEARVFALANPDEDRTFDEPAPIPMARGLRDPAWKRWEDKLAELPDQEYQIGRRTYAIKRDGGFADGPDHPLYRFIEEVRLGTAFCASYRKVTYVNSHDGARVKRIDEVDGEDHETLRPLFIKLGCEVLGPEREAQLQEYRRAAASGEPMLDRRFATKTDCADGHVGEHPILSTFTDSTGHKRVRRACIWCPSVWSETV